MKHVFRMLVGLAALAVAFVFLTGLAVVLEILRVKAVDVFAFLIVLAFGCLAYVTGEEILWRPKRGRKKR